MNVHNSSSADDLVIVASCCCSSLHVSGGFWYLDRLSETTRIEIITELETMERNTQDKPMRHIQKLEV